MRLKILKIPSKTSNVVMKNSKTRILNAFWKFTFIHVKTMWRIVATLNVLIKKTIARIRTL